jgi:hypothetical protein
MDTTPDVKLDATEVYVLLLGLNELAIPPYCENPHTTTLPLFFNAANANNDEYIVTTPEVKLDATEVNVLLLGLNVLAFPPYCELPQVTTLPSFFNAANA